MKSSLSKTTRVRKNETDAIESFVYGDPSGSGGRNGPAAAIEGEMKARETRVLERGLQEGEARARSEFEQALRKERDALSAAIRHFAAEHDTYFRKVEAEVVQLALAITRKILFRESQIDPLLLTGVTRVALEKVANGTKVKLRVHPMQVPLWQDHFSRNPGMPMAPEIVGDASLELSQCVLETSMGVTDLSPEKQLKEIEQGFFDLLTYRPRTSDVAVSPPPHLSVPQSVIAGQQKEEISAAIPAASSSQAMEDLPAPAELPSQGKQETEEPPASTPAASPPRETEEAPVPAQIAPPQQEQAQPPEPAPEKVSRQEEEALPASAQSALPQQKKQAPAASRSPSTGEPKSNGKGRKRK